MKVPPAVVTLVTIYNDYKVIKFLIKVTIYLNIPCQQLHAVLHTEQPTVISQLRTDQRERERAVIIVADNANKMSRLIFL